MSPMGYAVMAYGVSLALLVGYGLMVWRKRRRVRRMQVLGRGGRS